MIVHCLDRKVKSSGFTATSVHDIDHDKGVFEIEKLSGTRHKVDFGSQTGEPSCTCKDWIRYHIQCKHFCVVFQYHSTWQCDSMPEAYLNGAYMLLVHTSRSTEVTCCNKLHQSFDINKDLFINPSRYCWLGCRVSDSTEVACWPNG